MGNISSQEKVNIIENDNIKLDNTKNNFIISDKKENLFLNNINDINNYNVDKFISSLNKQIESINEKLNSLNNKINNTNNDEQNKKDQFNFLGYPINNDYILGEMRTEFVKKKKNKFKSEIINDIKNKFISSILESLKTKDKEILDLKSNNNSLKDNINNLNNQLIKNNKKLKDEILNEFSLLKKQCETKYGSLENLIFVNNNKVINFQNSINSDLEKMKKNHEFDVSNLNKQIGESNSEIKTFKIKIKLDNEKFEKKIPNEIENLMKLIYLDFDKKEKDNNLKFEKLIIKHVNDIEEIKKDLLKVSSENENLKKVNEIKNNEIKHMNEKIGQNIKQIEIIKEDIKQINQNFKFNTSKIFKESISQFNSIFTENYILNKQKRQHEFKLKLYSNKNFATVGLDNIGNNCYLNSVLQILKNIPKFTYNILNFDDNSDNFLLSLKHLMINICNSNNSSFSPRDFKLLLGKENSRFSGDNQNDSTIFYISLLNIIHKKINKAKKENYKKLDISKYKDKSLQEKYDIWKENFLLKNESFIFDFFYIFFANEIECNSCHNKIQTFQTSNFLDFPIANGKKLVKNLEECFENYLMIKYFEDNCSKCHKTKLSQKFVILDLPPVLMINLKRVGENIAYFNELDIPYYLYIKKLIKNYKKNIIYELRGFIKHSGNENYGHNFAFCKNMFNDKWYEYNDSTCNSIENVPELNKIFFLCYIQVGNDVESVEYLKQIIELLNKKNPLNK